MLLIRSGNWIDKILIYKKYKQVFNIFFIIYLIIKNYF